MSQNVVPQSHTIVPSGVGGILDQRGESFVACDTYRWGNRARRIEARRLAAALHVRELRQPPVIDSSSWAPAADGIPYLRFPTWLFCQNCRSMIRWRRSMEQPGRRPECPRCPGRKPLVPMRWIQICEAGHLDDFDYAYWAHARQTDPNKRQCRQDAHLKFRTTAAGAGGLDTLVIECTTCGARRSLAGVSATESLKAIGVKCKGRQPWQRIDDAVSCDKPPRAVQRGASNVYFPLVHSSIEIPDPSRVDLQSDDALAVRGDDMFQALLGIDPSSPLAQMMLQQVAKQHGVTESFVMSVIAEETNAQAGSGTLVTAPVGDLRAEEWAAFITPLAGHPHPDFVTRHVPLAAEAERSPTGPFGVLQDRVARTVLVDRLREVRALEGFHRVTPGGADTLVRADLGRGLPWLPAIEVRGEGIFLSLDEVRLADWEGADAVAARVEALQNRVDASFLRDRLLEHTGPRLTPRYVLLHTLGHILIRRLAFESGYSATSLRERVYARSSGAEDAEPQAGLLVYTAAGDSEGTLGGLVRQGEPPRLARTLLEGLQDAMWCSSDPLCAENRATSFASLNLAACHACSIISETSCENGNYLLDRVLLVGSPTCPGFFQPVLDAGLVAMAD